jgi:hypothetical protein
VSLVALIANPERYDGSQIEVTAWGVIQFEMASIFLSEEDYLHSVSENGVRLELPEPESSGFRFPSRARGYMSVVGRFRAGDEYRGYAGRLTEVKEVNLVRSRLD